MIKYLDEFCYNKFFKVLSKLNKISGNWQCWHELKNKKVRIMDLFI
ncbi:hypothetical protein B6N60_01621 [Richelia sinica FACHB-800]|uniref:Uncharacterized protein n=1 Tax=Richelia sinica FACHB-800 TaxID=1357546 RepID=A0A975Y490_9NOST|nr:hypothetical protein B6N60_01621 [Richelia sinica FACHB-800]